MEPRDRQLNRGTKSVVQELFVESRGLRHHPIRRLESPTSFLCWTLAEAPTECWKFHQRRLRQTQRQARERGGQEGRTRNAERDGGPSATAMDGAAVVPDLPCSSGPATMQTCSPPPQRSLRLRCCFTRRSPAFMSQKHTFRAYF